MNQNNYTATNKKITQVQVEDMKKEPHDDQSSHVNESEEEQLKQLRTMNAGEQKQNLVPTTEEQMENHQKRISLN